MSELELEDHVPPPRRPTWREVWPAVAVWLAIGAAVAVALYLLTPVPQLAREHWLESVYASSFVFVLLVAAWQHSLLRLAWLAPRHLLAVGAGCLALSAAVSAAGAEIAGDVVLLVAGGMLGLVLATLIQRPWWLVPAGICVALADTWSVFAPQGVSRQVLEQAPEAVSYLTVTVPVLGLDGALVLGAVDIAFIAMYGAVAAWWGSRTLVTAVALALALPVTVWLSVDVLEGRPVPALPAFALAFVLANAPGLWRDWRRG